MASFRRADDLRAQFERQPMDRVDVFARARPKAHVMQSAALLRKRRIAELRRAARDPEAGPSADTIKLLGSVAHGMGQAEKWQQSPVKRGAFVEFDHADENMGDAVDFHG